MSAACPGNESIVIKRVSAKMSLNKTYLLHIKLSKIKDLLAHVLNKNNHVCVQLKIFKREGEGFYKSLKNLTTNIFK